MVKDQHGAEVSVQTGTGTIKALTPMGKPDASGVYRNVEVEFQPDNPKLVRKVYGHLDTTSADLYRHIQAAYETQQNVSYRTESRRKRNIDRAIPFSDLTPTEDVVRILASVDTFVSTEVTNNLCDDLSGSVTSYPTLSEELMLERLRSAVNYGLDEQILVAAAGILLVNTNLPVECILAALHGYEADTDTDTDTDNTFPIVDDNIYLKQVETKETVKGSNSNDGLSPVDSLITLMELAGLKNHADAVTALIHARTGHSNPHDVPEDELNNFLNNYRRLGSRAIEQFRADALNVVAA